MNISDNIKITTDMVSMTGEVVKRIGRNHKIKLENNEYVLFQFDNQNDIETRYNDFCWTTGYFKQYPLKLNYWLDCSIKKI